MRADNRAGALASVSELRWDVELPFGSFAHKLERFNPTRDNLVYTEGGWCTAFNRAVEHGTVDKATGVVHSNLVVG